MDWDFSKFVVWPKPKELNVKDLTELEQYPPMKEKLGLYKAYKELDL